MPRVSVIMPAYNCMRYVRKAVESIRAQTFGDFDFIIIDDGSTDGSRELLMSLAKDDARIRLVSRPNTGYTKALIEAMTLTTSPLIARMDADDIALPDRLAKQVAQFEADPQLVLLGGAFEFIDAEGRRIRRFSPPAGHAELDLLAATGGNPFCHPLVMFRRDAYERVGGYDAQYEPAEDLDLWLKLAEVGRVAALPDLLLLYRQHDASVSQQRQQRQLERIRAACEAAAARRGIEVEIIHRPWRPESPLAQATQFGWWAFGSGERATARHYALRAVRRGPLSIEAWKLLACSMFKPLPTGGSA